ncbi:SMI1/KNR4 family protein [Winogradskyella tangerina]|uniref:SMI1/KNR4 family protein n=1 Tax=Winogradskyella tangerina TaxID=2023240 RepID=UPI000DBE6F04|nr:SMI1/KNR4 family protein [Winogradskyella tangerina]
MTFEHKLLIQRYYFFKFESIDATEPKSSIEQKLKFIYKDDLFPLGLLPFARDGGSGNYLISMREQDFGQIFIMNADSEMPFFLCNSFEEFINKLEAE